jgi:hypothetical protein
MHGKPEGHGRSARLVALPLRRHREAQCSVGTYPVVLKKLQVDEGIPSGVPFGKGMGLASQGIESIAEGTIDPLNMDSGRLRDRLAQGGTDLDGEQLAMLIAMLDGLCQANVWRDHQWGTSGLV